MAAPAACDCSLRTREARDRVRFVRLSLRSSDTVGQSRRREPSAQSPRRVRPDGQTPRVHLARLGLRGFKSFPDPVELRFEPGVAILVGPNGSGKSNVADAIVWASGSLSPTELRAEKPDDVLFGGAGERPAAAFCEVALVFEDAEGAGGPDFAELAIARRLHRGGEGQYLLGGASVRRTGGVEPP